ncbi:MAG: hypothetical protein ACXVZX_08510, partial [Terriglobales bacterium]
MAQIRADEIIKLIREQIEHYETRISVDEVGTVMSLGDHSDSMARLEPGTPVAIEGPYGAFTKHVRKSDRILLVG